MSRIWHAWLFTAGVYSLCLSAPWCHADEASSVSTPPANPTVVALAPGNSSHGEAFDEGPRQRAYLMAGMPAIQFPLSTTNEQAKAFILQGIGQLHGFWYFEAERSFRQAAAFDTDCAIAYWGMAMANIENEKRAQGFIAEAVKRKDKADDREKMYIDSLEAFLKSEGKKKEGFQAFAKAYERILYRYPDDVEAKAFLALQLWKNDDQGFKIESYWAVNALLNEIHAVQPMHPAHHYRIHLWDKEKAEKALASAALCGQSGPGIAHLWHMPGHTFSNLKRYSDAAWQQEASARVDHAYMLRDRILPDQIHNYAHNNEWMIRNLCQLGRVSDAVALAKNMCDLPRHPKYNSFTKRGSAALGRERLVSTLAQFELWKELLTLAPAYLEPTDQEIEQLRRFRALGAAYYLTGDLTQAEAMRLHLVRNLESVHLQQHDAELAAGQKAAADKKDQKHIDREKENARKSYESRITDWQKGVAELEGYAAVVRKDYRAAIDLLKKADVSAGYIATLQLLAGDTEAALKAAQEFVNAHVGEVLPLAWQVEVLTAANKSEDAKVAFEKLRQISSTIDLASPRFQRLTAIAKQWSFADDWRIPQPSASDVGQRPDLASLGPVHWQPSVAPNFDVKNALGESVSLQSYHGRPIVLIFFLGHGCLHCAEQLQAFAPFAQRFKDAGFELVAVSSDDGSGLRKSLETYGGPMPVTLASDAAGNSFKEYRCYDDFENKPLHGTFVIDGRGYVRWQDIGAEPFMDPAFVLREGQRLHSLPVNP